MATTKQNMEDDSKDFGASFNEEATVAPEQTEDEAFGLSLPQGDEMAAEGDGETDGSELVVQADPESLPAEPPAAEVDAAEAEAAAGEDAMPEMSQSEKSWEGRLRAREAELKAMAADLEAKKNVPVAIPDEIMEEAGESATEQSAEGDSGEAEEAMRQLSEDFGPDFVKMIVAIAGKKAAEAAGARVDEVGNTVSELIADINDSRSRRHFEDIYDEHPDFAETAASETFRAWIAAMQPEAQGDANRVAEGGSAKEINRLLSAFKAANDSGAIDESGIDAAEGVRSTGMRLPAQPGAGSDDFASAWDEQA
jgi:hypothetical protein